MKNDSEKISQLIRDKVGQRSTEEALSLTLSLETSVEQFVRQFEGDTLTDEQLAQEYLDWSDEGR
jgi:hypothetical protein